MTINWDPVPYVGPVPVNWYGLSLKMRSRLREGSLFLLYLALFSVLRFLLFFVRGDVPVVALGLTNGHWTALVLLALALPWLVSVISKRRIRAPAH